MKYYLRNEEKSEVRLANIDGTICYVDMRTNQIIGRASEIKAYSDATEDSARLGAIMRTARKEKKLTIGEIVDILNTGRTQINNFELGKGSVNLTTFLKMADLYGLTVNLAPRNGKGKSETCPCILAVPAVAEPKSIKADLPPVVLEEEEDPEPKKFVITSAIVDEKAFIDDIVNHMPAICSARLEFTGMDYCLFVDGTRKSVDEAVRFLKANKVRFMLTHTYVVNDEETGNWVLYNGESLEDAKEAIRSSWEEDAKIGVDSTPLSLYKDGVQIWTDKLNAKRDLDELI